MNPVTRPVTPTNQPITEYRVPAKAERMLAACSAIVKDALASGNIHEAIAAQKSINELIKRYPKLESKLEE